jgi:hypothetical protein
MSKNTATHWNIIKQELGFRQPGNDDFVRWAKNQQELYSETELAVGRQFEQYGLIVSRTATVYSHPLLEIARGELAFATLIQQLGQSDSGEWTLIKTVDYREIQGWVRTEQVDSISTAAYKLFKSEPSTRFTFLDAQSYA